MKRNIIEINEDLCTGCGECITACAEGALELIDGKAKLVSDVYCDGLGACLSGCPTGALKVIEREADEFSEEAVKEREAKIKEQEAPVKEDTLPCGCPGTVATVLKRPAAACPGSAPVINLNAGATVSELTHWPVKLELIRPDAPFLRGADLVLLADCAGVSVPDLHQRILKGRAVAIACPKFTDLEQTIARLTAVLRDGGVGSLTVVHMEVPCCRGLVVAAEKALQRSGADIELTRVKVGREGRVLEEETLHAARSRAASR